MVGRKTVILKVDNDAGAAYISLSDEPVHETLQFNEDVLIDLDQHRVAVGIEVLDLDAEIPYRELEHDYHVHSKVINELKAIRPTINGFVLSTAPSGTSQLSELKVPVPA